MTIPWGCDPADAKYFAERLCKILANRTGPDGRFRPGTIKGQMQDIYLASRDRGIVLKPVHLLHLWRDQYGEKNRLDVLRRQRSNAIRQQVNLARRIKNLTVQIEAHGG